MEKKIIANQNIRSKIERWIKECVTNRIFIVVINGSVSGEEDVSSGVPQGSVLVSILSQYWSVFRRRHHSKYNMARGESLIEFMEEKVEQLSGGNTGDASVTPDKDQQERKW